MLWTKAYGEGQIEDLQLPALHQVADEIVLVQVVHNRPTSYRKNTTGDLLPRSKKFNKALMKVYTKPPAGSL